MDFSKLLSEWPLASRRRRSFYLLLIHYSTVKSFLHISQQGWVQSAGSAIAQRVKGLAQRAQQQQLGEAGLEPPTVRSVTQCLSPKPPCRFSDWYPPQHSSTEKHSTLNHCGIAYPADSGIKPRTFCCAVTNYAAVFLSTSILRTVDSQHIATAVLQNKERFKGMNANAYQRYLLCIKWGGLSLTSVSFTVTVVVPESPPRWPPMSLAWRTTRYWSWVSLSKSGTAVRKIPEREREIKRTRTREMKSNNKAARPLSKVLNPQLHAWALCCPTCKMWSIKLSITSSYVI